MKAKKGAMIVAALFLLFCVAAEAQEITEEQAFDAILEAQDNIQEMTDSGFNTTMANDLMQDARNAFAGENYTKLLLETERINDTRKREQAKKLIEAAKNALGDKKGDYPTVLLKTSEIIELRNRAFEVYDLMLALDMRIKELSSIIELKDAGQKLSEAKTYFYSESYDDAEKTANEGFAIVDRKAAEATELNLLYRAGKENLEFFLRENWKKLLIGLFIALVFGLIFYKQLSIILAKKRLDSLRLERQVLLDLIKKAQYERFNLGAITNKEYEIKTSKFKERIVEVEKEIPVLEEKFTLKGIKKEKTAEVKQKKEKSA